MRRSFCFSRSRMPNSLALRRVGRGPLVHRALLGVALLAFEVEFHPLPAAQPADRCGIATHLHPPSELRHAYTRRRFGGRHPLCGMGGTSLIRLTSSPAACSDRMAASRAPPRPLPPPPTS